MQKAKRQLTLVVVTELNIIGDEILQRKRVSVAHRLSLLSYHCPDITEFLFKGCTAHYKPHIYPYLDHLEIIDSWLF